MRYLHFVDETGAHMIIICAGIRRKVDGSMDVWDCDEGLWTIPAGPEAQMAWETMERWATEDEEKSA